MRVEKWKEEKIKRKLAAGPSESFLAKCDKKASKKLVDNPNKRLKKKLGSNLRKIIQLIEKTSYNFINSKSFNKIEKFTRL